MAKKEAGSYMEQQREFNRDLQEGKFASVYMICGEQAYLRSQNRDKLMKACIGDGDMMNVLAVRESADADAIIDFADTLPFFAERRVVLIEDTGLFSRPGEDAEKLAEYIGRIPETSVLIFVEEKPLKTTKLWKKVAKEGFVLECSTPDEATLAQWCASRFRLRGGAIRRDALARFLALVGQDMGNIDSEVEKLCAYTAGEREITAEDVDILTSRAPRDRIFDMISAITRRDAREAMAIYMELRDIQTPPQVILSLMLRQFRQLIMIGELSGSSGDGEIAQLLKVNPYILSKRLRPLLRGYTAARLERCIGACIRADTDYKSGKIDGRIAVEELIATLSAGE